MGSVESRLRNPITLTSDIKPRYDWFLEEKKSSLANAKALNTIFSGIDQEQFKLISKYEIAKKA